MGLLDRYGTLEPNENGNATEKSTRNSGSERLNDVNASFDPFEEVKSRIHNSIIEHQLSAGLDITEESMRKLIDEYVEKPEYNIPRISKTS